VAHEIEYEQLADDGAAQSSSDLERLGDVEVEVSAEIGRRRLTIAETLELAPGSLIALGRPAGDPVDLLVNGRRIGRGEVVVIDDEFGIRVTEVVSPRRRAESSRAAAGGEPASTAADGEPVA